MDLESARSWILACAVAMVAGCNGEVALNGLAPPDGDPHQGADGGHAAAPDIDASRPSPTPEASLPDGDATSTPMDSAPETALEVCERTCGGCCSADGECGGGDDLSACGIDGEVCVNCFSVTKPVPIVCDHGQCVGPMPAPDAGTSDADTASDADASLSSCAPSNCGVCIPIYSAPCCKADDTCGCQVVYPEASASAACQ
jgi:hypothetical protein